MFSLVRLPSGSWQRVCLHAGRLVREKQVFPKPACFPIGFCLFLESRLPRYGRTVVRLFLYFPGVNKKLSNCQTCWKHTHTQHGHHPDTHRWTRTPVPHGDTHTGTYIHAHVCTHAHTQTQKKELGRPKAAHQNPETHNSRQAPRPRTKGTCKRVMATKRGPAHRTVHDDERLFHGTPHRRNHSVPSLKRKKQQSLLPGSHSPAQSRVHPALGTASFKGNPWPLVKT